MTETIPEPIPDGADEVAVNYIIIEEGEVRVNEGDVLGLRPEVRLALDPATGQVDMTVAGMPAEIMPDLFSYFASVLDGTNVDAGGAA